MAIIYISSTYKDLINERKAAAQAVRRLGHHTLAMEDYVASDQRPVDKCLQDVKNSDGYVGIFAFRYGFIPDGFDKSITHLEYEAAVKAGIPCLIFLMDPKANCPAENVATGEDGEKINHLRQTLEKKYNRSLFKTADELGGLVSAAVSNTFHALQAHTGLGSIVSKMCNRETQVKKFKDFFKINFTTCPKRPQFFFLHGDDLQGHECFLERLVNTCLKEFAEKEWTPEYATLRLENVPWPKTGDLRDRQGHLKESLISQFSTFNKHNDIPGFKATTLGQLPCFEKRPLVVLKHEIFSSKWDKVTQPLLMWYIQEFWATLGKQENESNPLFLIFFNIHYWHDMETGLIQKIRQWKYNPKKVIQQQLFHLSSAVERDCQCLVLPELCSVAIEDVLDWFIHHHIYEYEEDRKNKVDALFMEKNKRVTAIRWAKLVKELSKIVADFNKGRSGYNEHIEF